MANYRFRNEGELLVLQVSVAPESDYYGRNRDWTWRDAKVTDFDASLLTGPFNVTHPEKSSSCAGLVNDGAGWAGCL